MEAQKNRGNMYNVLHQHCTGCEVSEIYTDLQEKRIFHNAKSSINPSDGY